MAQVLPGNSAKVVQISSWKTYLVGILVLMLCLSGNESAHATTGVGPYEVPKVKDADNDPSNGIETWIVAEEATVNIGNGVSANNGMTFKSCSDEKLKDCTTPGIPGPEFRLTVGDRIIVHFVNNLKTSGLDPEANVSGIHWHGIELNNESDGTEVTQHAVAPGERFTYDFTVSRPGIFWYHPHHHSSTNQVAKGLYGSIIIEDKFGYEAALIAQNVIPSAAQTKTLVISDITVCGAPGSNPATFPGDLPHVSGVQAWEINYQNHILTQSPRLLCEAHPIDANGAYTPNPYQAGDIPNIQSDDLIGPMSEGFTVLTNGVNVGGRSGSPSEPGALEGTAETLDVEAGQGLRLQIVNPSPVRYLRLRLTTNNGKQISLVRIGGEGGLLNHAHVEGGMTGRYFDTKYEQGEILLPPAGRADVVAAIPSAATGVLTLWTEDFQRVAATYSWTPTVPVMHLKVTGSGTSYGIGNDTPLLASLGSEAMVKALNGANNDLVVPVGEDGVNGAPAGTTNKDIELTFFNNTGAFQPSVDGIPMPRDFNGDFSGNPFYLESARHAKLDNTMDLKVTNMTGANHPFHLHGFSVQPIELTPRAGTYGPSYTFPLEFRDIVDVPANYTLTFRVSLDDRLKKDNQTAGGGVGRWLFHCHILPHATFGMMSELHVHH
ncbi:MAG: multicopper oxidase family protein [Nitrospira sp.]|nr:multicopper oxidase family protein [Nitrospira sp.]MDH4370149.1 multicopper oxidase family protein [Nitrospira sp.]MDH5347360.1 multicopper oxidase family protein [Nitrospira sp.]MDH5497682.1 multicopper oxidase family protein [Nitrospira sp.]MDH5725088.1 multicopper oxidase family protein [Nitrospira sp.]